MTPAEFETSYCDLKRDMLKVARKTLRVREDAEEVVHQTFLELLTTGNLVRLDSSRNFRAFIFCRLIWNLQKALTRLRRDPIKGDYGDYAVKDKFGEWGVELDNDENGENVVLVYTTDEDRRIDVYRALTLLSHRQRAVVDSIIIMGRSFVETGKHLWPHLRPYARRRLASQLFQESLQTLRVALRDYDNTARPE